MSVHYYYWWVEGAKSIWCQGFADRQTYRTGGGTRYIEVGTKVSVTGQMHIYLFLKDNYMAAWKSKIRVKKMEMIKVISTISAASSYTVFCKQTWLNLTQPNFT